MQNCAVLTIIACLFFVQIESAKILGIFYIPSLSHQRVFQPIWKQLSLRGHQVTILTTDPLKDSTLVNLTEVDLSFVYDILSKYSLQTAAFKNVPAKKIVNHFYQMADDIIKAEIRYPPVIEILRNASTRFDAVLLEVPAPLLYSLGAKFNCPIIGITSTDFLTTTHDALGNAFDPVAQSAFTSICTESLNIFQRLYCTYFDVWFRYFYHSYSLPEQESVAKRYISNKLPHLWDIEKNISMVFSAISPTFRTVKSNVPLITGIEGMHLQSHPSLPKDLQHELDTATNGAVYFSLGSNVRSVSLPQEMQTQIIETFKELPYKIFWKWEGDELPDKPPNVIIRKWYPQQGMLGHPNVKVFVTQGGLQSMEEAISSGVPFVGMPFFGDQTLNVIKIVNLKIGLSVDAETLTKEMLKASIIEVAENPKYRSNINAVAKLIYDTPMKALDKVMWWTEYVIRHNGTKHLRSPVMDISWFSYFLVDVICFLTVILVLTLFILYNVIIFSVKIALQLKLRFNSFG